MSVHTPGPWSLWKDVCHGEHGMITDDAHARHIARMEGGAPETVANARLIVAAPELLAACQAQHKAIDILMAMLIDAKTGFMPTKSPAWEAVVAGSCAIAKATGSAA